MLIHELNTILVSETYVFSRILLIALIEAPPHKQIKDIVIQMAILSIQYIEE